MRIRTLNVKNAKQETELKIQFAKRSPSGGNFFSVLVGENGTRKSQSLRTVLDLSHSSIDRVRKLGRSIETKQGELVYWSNRNTDRDVLPSKIIAVSGVATDRFPSRISGRAKRPAKDDTYRYIGPRSENNLVSRTQSLQEVVLVLLSHLDRVPARRRQLAAAFDLLPIANGCLFNFKRVGKSDEGPTWDWNDLIKHLENGDGTIRQVRVAKEMQTNLRKQCLELLNSTLPIELRLDLDDLDSVGISHEVSAEALAASLECGAISLGETYSISPSNEIFPLAEFSSGQWQILSSLLFVALAVEDDTLILVDEPENSLHPQWQREYLNLFLKAISSCEGVHVLVATHSPLVASSLPPVDAEVIRLARTRYGNLIAKEVQAGPFGWTADDILEKVFGLRSTRSELFTKEMDLALKLFAQGDRKNPDLIKRVEALSRFAERLPEGDVARSVIATMRSVILADEKTANTSV